MLVAFLIFSNLVGHFLHTLLRFHIHLTALLTALFFLHDEQLFMSKKKEKRKKKQIDYFFFLALITEKSAAFSPLPSI